MRICFIADSRSIHTIRWVRFFTERGHTVAIVSHYAPLSELSVAAHYPLSVRTSVPGTRILRNTIEVRSAIRDFQPDVLHAHYINECGWLAALSGFHPFILTAWGSDVYLAPRQSALARVLTPWSVRCADYLTADSFDQIEHLRGMGASERATQVINWGVDLNEFTGGGGAEWRERHHIAPDRIVILSPRQWIANSNIDIIVEAFSLVHAAQQNTLLLLKYLTNTTDSMRQKIMTRIKALGLTDSVLIIGEVAVEELPGIYAAADITISICSSDGTSVSLLEAMASRSVVVASNIPSTAEWIRDEISGFLVATRDARQLAQQILRVVSDAGLRHTIGQNGRAIIEQKGDRAKNLAQVELICKGLISCKTSHTHLIITNNQ